MNREPIWPPRQIHLVQTGEGKRYVRVGKRKIKVHRSISNNELIKWVIKHFKPKRRKRGEKEGKKDKGKSTALPNDAFPTAGLVQQADIARTQARETKEKLDKAEADLKQMQLVQAVKEQKEPAAASVAVVPKIGAPSNIPVRKLDVGEHEPIFSIAQAKEGVERIRKHTEAAAKAADAAAQSKIDASAASERQAKEGERQVRLQRMIDDKQKLMDAAEERVKKALLKSYTKDVMSSRIDKRNTVRTKEGKKEKLTYDSKTPHATLMQMLLDEGKNLLLEDEVRAQEAEKIAPEIAKIDAAIVKLRQEGNGVDLCNRQSGNGISDAQIERKMHTGKYPDYWGTMAADEIPEIKPGNVKRVGWIMNTDVRALPGVHWVAFLIDLREGHRPVIEYYDPLADPFEVLLAKDPFVRRDLKALLKRMGAPSNIEFKQNRVADQNNTSNNCGPFAIRFLQQRFKGKDFAQASGLDASGEHVIELWKHKK